MDRSKHGKNSQRSFGNILHWTVGTLIMLTMISTLMLSNLFAKYIVNDSSYDAARVAAGGTIKLLEYEVTLKDGIYVLDESVEPTSNPKTYSTVIPGVDIAKCPFIKLDLEYAEVDYMLFVQVTESKYFPETVTYDLTDDWEVFDESNGIYKYKGYFDAATPYEDIIKILKNDKLYVSEHYVGKDEDGNNLEFSLTFNAWIRQVD